MSARSKFVEMWGGAALVVLAACAVAYARPRVVAATNRVKETSDVFALPAPSMLIALSLGYRSALADWLYTATIVSYGIHGEEHRRFDFVGKYLESIALLDPTFCQPYRYADTFIIYQPTGSPGPDEVRTARRLIERGLEACPSDDRLWLSGGQFMAFIGPQFLTDESEKQELKLAGARALAHAAELSSGNQKAQWQALAAAGIFTREGNREAAIAFLEKAYAVTDDDELKRDIHAKLDTLRQEGAFERAKRRAQAFEEEWRRDLSFVSRTGILVLGPRFDASRCSGGAHSERQCSQSWADWIRAYQAE